MEWSIIQAKSKSIPQPNIKSKENTSIWKSKLSTSLPQGPQWRMELFLLSLLKILQEPMLPKSWIGIYLMSLTQELCKVILSSKNLWMFGNSCMGKKTTVKTFHSLITNIWDLKLPHLAKKTSFGSSMEKPSNKGQPPSVWSEMPSTHPEKLHMIKCQIMMGQTGKFSLYRQLQPIRKRKIYFYDRSKGCSPYSA